MNLQDLPKDTLIEITRRVRGSVGDTGRNNKQHYVDLLTSEHYDAAIAEALKTVAPKVIRIVVTPKGEVETPDVVHPLFDKILKLAGLRHNILLVGPAGVGKTTLGHQIATALSLPFAAISCSAGMSESQFSGYLLPVGDHGKFEYVMSKFVELYENGGVFLIDEFDAMDGNVGVFLNAALANGGFFVQQRIGNQWVKRHPDFICIAAANTFGHGGDMVYAGRERLDGATLDRFRSATLYMDYQADMEEALVDAEVLAWGREIRQQIEQLKLRRVMSTRVMIAFSEQKANLDFVQADWELSYFADWTKDEMRKIGRAQ